MDIQIGRSVFYSVGLGIVIFASLIFTSCKEMNNDPADKKASLNLNLKNIQHQLGYTDQQIAGSRTVSSALTQPGDTEATSAVNVLIIGSITLNGLDGRRGNTPYSIFEPLTSTVKDDLEADLTNSANFIKTIILPTSSEMVKFKLPPEGAGNWQVVAVAVNLSSLSGSTPPILQDAVEGDILYSGYSSKVYNTPNVLKNGISETLILQRNCFNDSVIPNGCATYSYDIDDDPIVTDAVEIVGVKINDIDQTHSSFPMIVRSTASGGKQVLTLGAINNLNAIKSAFPGYPSSIDTLTVITTHTKNPTESSACRAFGDTTNDTTTDIMTACEEQVYKMPVTQ
ncbi:MAG: hypothetical protein GY786_01345 [Proteobacteria bacterium]|nr:hypothetical protein [Pseudomonadota bacterium]